MPGALLSAYAACGARRCTHSRGIMRAMQRPALVPARRCEEQLKVQEHAPFASVGGGPKQASALTNELRFIAHELLVGTTLRAPER